MSYTEVMPPVRPEFVRETRDAGNIGEIARPLSLWERVSGNTAARRIFILVVLAAAWEAYSVPLDNPLLFPTFHETATAAPPPTTRTVASVFSVIG